MAASTETALHRSAPGSPLKGTWKRSIRKGQFDDVCGSDQGSEQEKGSMKVAAFVEEFGEWLENRRNMRWLNTNLNPRSAAEKCGELEEQIACGEEKKMKMERAMNTLKSQGAISRADMNILKSASEFLEQVNDTITNLKKKKETLRNATIEEWFDSLVELGTLAFAKNIKKHSKRKVTKIKVQPCRRTDSLKTLSDAAEFAMESEERKLLEEKIERDERVKKLKAEQVMKKRQNVHEESRISKKGRIGETLGAGEKEESESPPTTGQVSKCHLVRPSSKIQSINGVLSKAKHPKPAGLRRPARKRF